MLKVRFRSRLGWRQTNERTSVKIPAIMRHISKKDQASMRRLETILAERTGEEGEREALLQDDALPERIQYQTS